MSDSNIQKDNSNKTQNKELSLYPLDNQKEVMKKLFLINDINEINDTLKYNFNSKAYSIEHNELPFNFVPIIQPKHEEYILPSCFHLKNIDEDSKCYSDTEKTKRKNVRKFFRKRLSINEMILYKKAIKTVSEENECKQEKQIGNVLKYKGTKGQKNGITILQKLKKVKMNHL